MKAKHCNQYTNQLYYAFCGFGRCEHIATSVVDKLFNRGGDGRQETSERRMLIEPRYFFFLWIIHQCVTWSVFFVKIYSMIHLPLLSSHHVGFLSWTSKCARGYHRTRSPITAALSNKAVKGALENLQRRDLKSCVLADWRSKSMFYGWALS